ncbi:MAG: cytochrome c-type biogenesis protein [Anaplasma sp.]
MKRLVFLFFLCVAFPCRAHSSFVIDDRLPSGHMESRAVGLFKMTRCLVCSGESLHDSQSAFAADVRAMIRGKILCGRTDDEILQDLRSLYGDRVLRVTPCDVRTYFLWGLPIVLPIVLGVLMLAKLRRLMTSDSGRRS